jgi:hypothetical protein
VVDVIHGIKPRVNAFLPFIVVGSVVVVILCRKVETTIQLGSLIFTRKFKFHMNVHSTWAGESGV